MSPGRPPDQRQRHITRTVRTLMSNTDQGIDDIARALGQTYQTANRKLGGTRKWSLDDVYDLADHYGIPPGDILQGPKAALDALDTRRPKILGADQRHIPDASADRAADTTPSTPAPYTQDGAAFHPEVHDPNNTPVA
ncbi:hypothetical protein HNR23_001710 [Nocardiopsis mwathae]|uniref:HTH cro/C1-type domain-containing protein n=1 Tax=Nocardiopsis mwathae TaxID=1472723 RepID=A0A7X0D4Z3_9ACTN|nr:helix-turn-helix transcriptional regulator [Nocardiopsis mwathae]MBB6171650.1 hypothetical protein [Nocardiopsis mwathae]